jgi:hypothetical protein
MEKITPSSGSGIRGDGALLGSFDRLPPRKKSRLFAAFDPGATRQKRPQIA